MKIKCGDIVYFLHGFAEVGPSKRHLDEKMYEVYPIETSGDFYMYADPIWIPKSSIAEHYSVRNRHDFHHAWISLGFQPEIGEDEVRFRKMFEHEHTDEGAVESLSSESSDTSSDIRSNCSWSTEESGSCGSFVTDTCESEHACEEPDCDLCKSIRDDAQWFRRAWHPNDPTEAAIKRFIENIEEKYT